MLIRIAMIIVGNDIFPATETRKKHNAKDI